MVHKKVLEALERTLKDIRGNQKLFGGALNLLSGDFLQILHIISRSTSADEINACLKLSILWQYVHKFNLKTNIGVHLQNDASAVRFVKQLMEMGSGKLAFDESTQCITLSNNFCKITVMIKELIDKVFLNHRNRQ